MHDAADRGDAVALREAAHTLRGSSATIGASAMASLAGKVEKLATLDALNDARGRVAELPETLVASTAQLDEFVTRVTR